MITFIILSVLAILVCIYPPITVFIAALTHNGGDGFALDAYLRASGYETLMQWMRGLTFLGAGIASYKLIRSQRQDKETRRTKLLTWAILGMAAWVAAVTLLKGGKTSYVPGAVLYSGSLVAPIVFAYWRDKWARVIFIAILFVQLSLAMAIVLMPSGPLGVLQAVRYDTGLGDLSSVPQDFSGELARISGQSRLFAQFLSPNTYGVYAVIGIAVGSYMLLLYRSWRLKLLGGVLFVLGAFGWINTVSRGATLGLLAGVLIVAVKEITSKRAVVLTCALVLAAGMGYLAISDWDASDLTDLFFVHTDNEAVSVRWTAAEAGMEQIAQSPLLGAPVDYVWPFNIAPHQVMLYFAASHGVPAGIMLTLLLLTLVQLKLGYVKANLPRSERWEMHLSVVIGWIILATGITNNLSAPVLFWVGWAIGCGPWLERWQSGNQEPDDIPPQQEEYGNLQEAQW